MQDEDKHGKLFILVRNPGGLDGKVSSNTQQCYEDSKTKYVTQEGMQIIKMEI